MQSLVELPTSLKMPTSLNVSQRLLIFKQYTKNICKPASSQGSAAFREKHFWEFKSKRVSTEFTAYPS